MASLQPIAGDDVGGGQVRLGFELDRCMSAVGVNGTIPDAPYAAMWTRATPPSELALGDKPIFVAWEWIDPDPVRSEMMKTEGFPAQGGTVRFTGLSPDGQIDRTGEASWSTGATWRLEAEGPPPPAATTGGSLAQYVESENGALSRWSWNWSTTSWFQQWTGTLRLESHWASTLFDSPVVSATFLRGRWSYTDGTIEFPIVRAA